MKTLPLILAGGIGKRFAPFTVSKPLFPFMGQPLILRLLNQLRVHGFNRALVVTNPTDYPILKKIKIPGLSLRLLIQTRPLGMADAVLQAKSALNHQPVLIMNAPTFVETSLFEKIIPAIKQPQDFFVVKSYTSYFPGGYLKYLNGHPHAIIEKPKPGTQPSNDVLLVFDHLLHPDVFINLIQKVQSQRDDIFELALTQYLRQFPVKIIHYSGSCLSLKYPHHILTLTQFLLTHQKPTSLPQLPSNVYVSGNINLGRQVQIMPGAILKGPLWLGDGVVIGDQAIVRESIIEANTVIGSRCEVVRSYIGENCDLHGAYVGDSVLENRVHLGYGTVTANLRLDHQPITYQNQPGSFIDSNQIKLGAFIASGVEVGINVSLMPGIVIGAEARIGPQSLIKGFVLPQAVVYNNSVL